MDYEKMSYDELLILSTKPLDIEERKKIAKLLAKRPPTQVLTGAGGIASKEEVSKL
jgi:hypothetical protein